MSYDNYRTPVKNLMRSENTQDLIEELLDTTDQFYDRKDVEGWLGGIFNELLDSVKDEVIVKAQADSWQEGYEQGKYDERMAETTRVDIGLGGYATANRSNPYRGKK